jgi:AraC family transcriptional regulator
MGQWDFRRREFERYLPGRLQAISILLSAHDTELRFNGVKIMGGQTPVGSFATPPGVRISGVHAGAQDFVQFLFEPHGLANVLDDMSIGQQSLELRPQFIPADAILLALSQRLAACFDALPRLDSLFLDTLLQSCLNQLIRRHAVSVHRRLSRGESLSPLALRRVISFIEENLSGSNRLTELAQIAGISRAHFARAFRNEVGATPHTYLIQRRVERALELLHRSPINIADIAAVTGFADHAHMTRTFTRYLGVSPSVVRA